MRQPAHLPIGIFVGFIVAASFALLAATPASAEDYRFGDMNLSIDTTVSMGVGIRTSKQSCTKINTANGGCAVNSSGQSNDINTDDGDINFGQWDPYSETVKFVSEAQAKWQNRGGSVDLHKDWQWISGSSAGCFLDLPIWTAMQGGRSPTGVTVHIGGQIHAATLTGRLSKYV